MCGEGGQRRAGSVCEGRCTCRGSFYGVLHAPSPTPHTVTPAPLPPPSTPTPPRPCMHAATTTRTCRSSHHPSFWLACLHPLWLGTSHATLGAGWVGGVGGRTGGWVDGWVGGWVGGRVGGCKCPCRGKSARQAPVAPATHPPLTHTHTHWLAHPQWTMVGGGCFFLTGAGLNAGAHSLVGG